MAEAAGKGSGTRAPGAPGGGIVGEPVTEAEAVRPRTPSSAQHRRAVQPHPFLPGARPRAQLKRWREAWLTKMMSLRPGPAPALTRRSALAPGCPPTKQQSPPPCTPSPLVSGTRHLSPERQGRGCRGQEARDQQKLCEELETF